MKILQLENGELVALEVALMYCIQNDRELSVETVGHLAVLREKLIKRSEAPQDFTGIIKEN